MDDETGVNPPDHPVWDNPFLVNLLFLAPTIFPLWMFVRDGSPLVGGGFTAALVLVFTILKVSAGTTLLISFLAFCGLCVEFFVRATLGSSMVAVISGIIDAVVGLALFVSLITWYVLGKPFVSHIQFLLRHPELPVAFVLLLASFCAVAILYTTRKTKSTVVTALVAKMVLSLVSLFVQGLVFFTALWHVVEAPIAFVSTPNEANSAVSDTSVITTGLVLAFVAFELEQLRTADRHPDATPVTAEEYPSVHAITTTVAAQLDVPKPTIAITERKPPEAITVGYRPISTTLILSEGLLTALSEEELETVIAHELAHVANGDAMVMTIAMLPAYLADRIVTKVTAEPFTDEDGSADFAEQTLSNIWNSAPAALIRFLLTLVAVLGKYTSRPVVALLSRSRELTADRTAAAVTGSPAALASALRLLDERIDGTPDTDLRELSSLSALSILPVDPTDTWGLFATHPSTEHRIAVLSDLAAEQEQHS